MRAQGARAMTPTEGRGSSEARDAGSLAPGARCLGALVSRWRQSVGDLAIVDVEAKVLADARERLEEVVPDFCLVARCLAACSPSASPRAHDAQRRARRRVCASCARSGARAAQEGARAAQEGARAAQDGPARETHWACGRPRSATPSRTIYRRSFSALPLSDQIRFFPPSRMATWRERRAASRPSWRRAWRR